MDGGSPCPEDGDFFYARPDAAETEEAINSSLIGICVQYVVLMYSVCTCIYTVTVCTHMQCMCMVKSIVLTAILRGYIGGISLYVHNGRFLHNSIL